jgi:heme-degrading monooxygenase HmoA
MKQMLETRFSYRAVLVVSLLAAAFGFGFFATNSRHVAAKGVAVARLWHGRVPEAKGDEYFQYLKESGIKKMEALPGNLGAQVFRRNENGVADFTVISYWESRESIKSWAGEDIEKTRYLDKDKEYLLEMEPNVKHFDVLLNDWKK